MYCMFIPLYIVFELVSYLAPTTLSLIAALFTNVRPILCVVIVASYNHLCLYMTPIVDFALVALLLTPSLAMVCIFEASIWNVSYQSLLIQIPVFCVARRSPGNSWDWVPGRYLDGSYARLQAMYIEAWFRCSCRHAFVYPLCSYI